MKEIDYKDLNTLRQTVDAAVVCTDGFAIFREKERQALLASVKTGDRVLFAGGFLGTVSNVKEKTLTVKIAEGVKVEIARGAVAQVLEKGESPELAERN